MRKVTTDQIRAGTTRWQGVAVVIPCRIIIIRWVEGNTQETKVGTKTHPVTK